MGACISAIVSFTASLMRCLSQTVCTCIGNMSLEQIAMMLQVVNFVNAVLVVVAALVSLFNPSDIGGFRVAALAISSYLVCFGCLLCCFEARIPEFESFARKWCGFMFTFFGRSVFLLFIATFLFSRDTSFTVGVGVFTVFNAMFNFYVMYHHGEYLTDPTKLKSVDAPSMKRADNEKEVKIVIEPPKQITDKQISVVVQPRLDDEKH